MGVGIAGPLPGSVPNLGAIRGRLVVIMDAVVVELQTGRFLVEVDFRPDVLGPFTKSELRAIKEALEDYFEQGY